MTKVQFLILKPNWAFPAGFEIDTITRTLNAPRFCDLFIDAGEEVVGSTCTGGV